MRITQESDYGLRVALYLSKLGYGKRIEAKSIAKNENVPLRFLLKLLRKLTHSGIIKSYRGVNGGYALNLMPEEITLMSIIKAIDGPIYLNRCLYDPGHCTANRNGHCYIHNSLLRVQNRLIKELESINFKDILENKIK